MKRAEAQAAATCQINCLLAPVEAPVCWSITLFHYSERVYYCTAGRDLQTVRPVRRERGKAAWSECTSPLHSTSLHRTGYKFHSYVVSLAIEDTQMFHFSIVCVRVIRVHSFISLQSAIASIACGRERRGKETAVVTLLLDK